MMKRRDFLKSAMALGVAAAIPVANKEPEFLWSTSGREAIREVMRIDSDGNVAFASDLTYEDVAAVQRVFEDAVVPRPDFIWISESAAKRLAEFG